jgi:glutamate formiminotransferase
MLVSCAIYISSGVASIASRVAASALAAHPRVAVVDTFTDVAYARSSVKLVGETGPLVAAARAAAAEALSLIDLSQEPHPAPHPRQGAVDMVSFMPLSEASADALADELAACDVAAWQLGGALGELGCPVLMYGPRAARSLLETRRGTSFFASVRAGSPREASTSLVLDFGGGGVVPGADGAAAAAMAAPSGTSAAGPPLPLRAGVAIVGVQPYVTNFNIQVEEATLDECRGAAGALRREMGVQVMALPHEASGTVEIGCNLQASQQHGSPAREAVLALVASSLPARARVRKSYVIGLTPDEARGKGVRWLAAAA